MRTNTVGYPVCCYNLFRNYYKKIKMAEPLKITPYRTYK